MSSDLQRIVSDIARCKERIAEMEAGTRGVVSPTYRHVDGGRAYSNQLHAQRQSLEKFELEYVQAKLGHGWSAADVIARMEQPARGPEPMPVQVVKVGDLTRGRLQSVLEENPGNFIPRSKLQELLHP